MLVLAAGAGFCYWTMFRDISVTVNGKQESLRIGSTVEDMLKDGDYFGAKPGRLMSVGGNVLNKVGGQRCRVLKDDAEIRQADYPVDKVEEHATYTVQDGGDVTEESTEENVALAPNVQMEPGGAIQFVSQWGTAGEKRVLKGKTSGETVDKEVVKPAQDMVVTSMTPKPQGGKYMALTFDDGPSGYTQQILDILAQKGVKATFYNLGTQAAERSSLVKAVVDGGHELASHTNAHQNLPNLDRDGLRNEISSAFDTLEGASGSRPQMMRAPYGAFTSTEWARAGDLISCNVLWNIDTLDWKRPGAEAIKNAVLSNAFNGAIALMHDGGGNREQDVQALPGIIDGLRDAGYELVTVGELMRLDRRFPEAVVNGTVSMPKDAVMPEV